MRALADPANEIFFDASRHAAARAVRGDGGEGAQGDLLREADRGGDRREALRLAKLCEDAGVKNGVVQDKLWLPGIRKFKLLRDQGFFGRILSVRGEFGYWVFTGEDDDQPAQRPSWNYRKEDGGGIIVDMLCHWRYVIDNLFGKVKSVSCLGATHMPKRVDEHGKTYACTSDDACYATFETDTGVVCQFNSSWTVRVRRDDLFTMQVDGTHGSAVVGLRKCWAQIDRHHAAPDLESGHRPARSTSSTAGRRCRTPPTYDNAFKIQWELFLKHVALDAPFPWTLREGAKGVQLAEAGLRSWRERRWIGIEPLVEGAAARCFGSEGPSCREVRSALGVCQEIDRIRH